jgi:filamentous hemagglutinin
MNSHLYRIVFNHALGLCQVVSELIRRPGQGASSTDGRSTAHVRAVSLGLWVAFGWIGMTSAASAGQVVGDPNAPGNQRPTVLGAPGAAPLVNIQTPSAAGVSRNTYNRFDVDQSGVVLNNSRTNTQTQLAGAVAGNPWLATGTAKIILNEVTGPNPSALNGYIEVAGDRAQVIIANPAGISCDGCGVINATRFTLTTGTPVLNGGALDGYRVTGGAISVGGTGLDASRADYADIITRALVANAGIWAPQLQVTLGTNQVSVDQSQIAPIAGDGAKPTFALDTSALGGMYAQKITLIGNEHGVGVRNAGTIGAQAGDLVVTVDGRLENTGQLQAQAANTTIQASGGVSNAGTISAARTLTLSTAQDIDNSGGTLNAGRLVVDAGSLRNAGGTITQTGLQGIALQTGALSNRGGTIGQPVADIGDTGGTDGGSSGAGTPTNTTGGGSGAGTGAASGASGGSIAPLADGEFHIAGLLDNDGGQMRAFSGFDLTTTSGLRNDGGQLALRQLTLGGGDLGNASGTLTIDGAARIHATSVINDAGQLTIGGPLTFAAGQFSNRGGSFNQLDAGATSLDVDGALDNTGGTLASNAARLSIASGALTNARGKISTNQFTVNATSLDNRGGTITASGSASNALTATDTLDNGDGGTLASNGDLTITASAFGNAGGTVQHAGQGDLTIDAATLHGAGGKLLSNGTLTLTGDDTDLSAGTTAAQRIAITTGALSTAHGSLSASGSDPLALNVRGAFDNTAGTVVGNGALQIHAGTLLNQGGAVQAAGGAPLAVDVDGLLDNSQHGTLGSDGDLSLSAATFDNRQGSVTHAGHGTLTIAATTLNGNGGTIGSNGALILTGNTTDLSGGTTQAESILITTGALNTSGGQVSALGGDPLQANVSGLFNNTGGEIVGNGALALNAGAFTNAHGRLIAAGAGATNVRVTGALDNTGGVFASTGATTLHAGSLDNTGGTLQASATAPLTLGVDGALTNDAGNVQSNGDIALTAGSVSNHGGTLQTTGAIDATVATTLDNTGGALIAGGDLAIQAATLLNRNTVSTGATAPTTGLYGQAVTLHAGMLDNSHGAVVARGALGVSGTTLTNASGVLDGQGAVTVTGSTLDNTAGQLAQHGASGQLTITLTQGLTNTGAGMIAAEGAAQVQAGSVDNHGGSLVAQHDLGLTSAGNLLNSSGGVLQTGGALTLTAGGTFDNSAGRVDATDAATIHAASIGNNGGQLLAGHAGAPDASLQIVTTGAIANRGGTMGNRAGDVIVQATSFDNGAGGTLVAQRDANLDRVGSFSNIAGTVFATRNLSDQNAAGTLDNTSGQMGSGGTTWLTVGQLTNSNGHLQADTLWLTVPMLTNNGGEVDGNNVHVTAGALNGIGRIYGAALLDTHLTGDYTHLAGQRLESDGVLKLTVDGTLTNQGTLQSAGELDVTAGNLVNTNGATINGSNTAHTGVANIVVGGTLDNQQGATLEGDTLTASANRLTNTGNILGDTVTLKAASLTNGRDLGTALAPVDYGEGFIGASNQLSLWVGNLANLDGELYSGGNLNIAGDAAGNAAGTLLNSSGWIQAQGNLTVTAQQITNQRRYFQTKDIALTPAEQAQNTTTTTVPIYRSDEINPNGLPPPGTPASQILDASQIAVLEAYCGSSAFGTPGKNGDQWCKGYQPDPDHDSHNIFADDLQAVVKDTLVSVTVLDFATAAGVMTAGVDVNLTGAVLNANSQLAAGRNLTIVNPTTGQTGMGAVINQSWVPTGTVKETVDQQIGIWEIDGGNHVWTLAGYNNWQPTTTGSATVNLLAGSAPSWITYNAGPGLTASITAGGTVNVTAAQVSNTEIGGPSLGPIAGPGNLSMASATGAFATGTTTAGGTSGNALTGPGGANGQTVGAASHPLSGYTPPNNAMVQQHTDAGAPFLMTTAPRFATGPVTSSDYLLQALGDNPANIQKRLGDGYYEQNLVLDQILQLTGRRNLTGTGDAMSQYTALMGNAAAQAAQLGLTLGAPLTSTQIAALQSDIVWLVDTVVDGQHVLSPVVYLSKATADHLQNQGALIAGDQVAIQAGTTLTNEGMISSDHGTLLSADTLINTGALQSGGTLAVTTRGDVINAGTLTAQSISVQAGRDLTNTGAITATGDAMLMAGRDLTTNVAPIQAGGNLAMVAGHDLTATASSIRAGGNAQLVAGNDLTLAAQSHATRSETASHGESAVAYATSAINAGGSLVLQAGHDLTSDGAQLGAGNQLALTAGNDLTLNAVTDRKSTTDLDIDGHTVTNRSTSDETVRGTGLTGANGVIAIAGHDLTATAATANTANGIVALAAGNDLTLNAAQENHSSSVDTKRSSGGMLSSKTTHTHDSVSDSDVIGTSVNGNGVSLSAGHDLTAQAAQVQAAQGIILTAGHDIALTTAQDVHSEEHDVSVKKSGAILGGAGELTYQGKATSTTQSTRQSDAIGTTLSGDTVTVAAGHDLTAAAAQIAGTGNVALVAGHDLTLTTADSTYDASSSQSKKTTGFMRSGIDITIGEQKQAQSDSLHQVTPTGTLVGSSDGSLTLSAGHDVLVHGSDLLSQTGTAIVGSNVTIDAAMGSTDTTQKQSQSTSGVTAGLGGVAGNLAHAVYGDQQTAARTNDPRLKALAAAQAAYQVKDGVAAMGDASQSAAQGGAVNIEVGIGGSHSSASTVTHDDKAYGSQIHSAGNVTIAALGDGTAGSGNLSVIGSQIAGSGITLAAANDLLLQSQAEQHSMTSRNENSSGGVGVSFGTDGLGIYAQAAVGKGSAHGNGTTHAQADITASDTLTLISGNDTTIAGAQVTGKGVLAAIGGNLNIVSDQDTDDYASKTIQAGAKVMVGITQSGFVSGSGYISQGKIDSHYTSVNDVSGIDAGSDGYNIFVGGNTDLKGAVITSAADASKNVLDTGSLSFEDLHNVSEYKASQTTVSGGSTMSSNIAGAIGAGLSMAVPQHENSDSDTKAGIAAGTIMVRDNPTQDLTGLDRNPTLDNQALKNSFDLQKVQDNQQTGQIAGQLGMTIAGDIAQAKTQAYLDASAQGGQDAQALATRGVLSEAGQQAIQSDYSQQRGVVNANQGTYDTWGPGGIGEILLHAGAGALSAGLGGGNAWQGATGAAAGEAATPWLVTNLGRNALPAASMLVGSLTGDRAGAATAGMGTQYNYLSHKQVDELNSACQAGAGTASCQQAVAEARQVSDKQNTAMIATCSDDPSGASCQGALRDAMIYSVGAYYGYTGNGDQLAGAGALMMQDVADSNSAYQRANDLATPIIRYGNPAITSMAVFGISLLACGGCDMDYRAPPGSGAVTSVGFPGEFLLYSARIPASVTANGVDNAIVDEYASSKAGGAGNVSVAQAPLVTPSGPYIELGSSEALAAQRAYAQTFNDSQGTLVIGRLQDTAAGADIGMTRLNEPDWTINVNDAWIQGGIDAQRPFYLGTPIKIGGLRSGDPIYPTTVYFRELQQLRAAGYYREGDLMLPPKGN